MIRKYQNAGNILYDDGKSLQRKSYSDWSKLSWSDKMKRRLQIAKHQFNESSNPIINSVSAIFGGYDPENPDLQTGIAPSPGVKKPIINLRDYRKLKKFKSELDWTPNSWFKKAVKRDSWTKQDEEELASHVKEYLNIERKTKENGTWLKMSDGSTWEGDPRSWVQLQSKNGKKLVQKRNFSAISSPDKIKNYPEYQGQTWLQDNYSMAKKWSGLEYDPNGTGRIFEVTYPKNSKMYEIDVNGRKWDELPNVFNFKIGDRTLNKITTNSLVSGAEMSGNDITKINNVIEGFGDKVNDTVIKKGIPRKSLLGNNGAFNLLDKNIFRIGIPIIIGTYGLDRNSKEKSK